MVVKRKLIQKKKKRVNHPVIIISVLLLLLSFFQLDRTHYYNRMASCDLWLSRSCVAVLLSQVFSLRTVEQRMITGILQQKLTVTVYILWAFPPPAACHESVAGDQAPLPWQRWLHPLSLLFRNCIFHQWILKSVNWKPKILYGKRSSMWWKELYTSTL